MLDKKLLQLCVCPRSHAKLVQRGDELWCQESALAYPIRDDIPVLIIDEARPLSDAECQALVSG